MKRKEGISVGKKTTREVEVERDLERRVERELTSVVEENHVSFFPVCIKDRKKGSGSQL